MSTILDEAEVCRLLSERESLQIQLDAVAARIDEIDRAVNASGEARLRAARQAEVTHQSPAEGEFLMPCCGRTPFEVSPWRDRMTLDPALVTCHKEGVQS